MRASRREKRLYQSQKYLAGRETPRVYAVGEIGPDPRRTLFLILCGVVAVALLAFVIYSVIVFTGVFLIWAVYVAAERSTCVVVTDTGVAVLARSEFNGRPRKFIASLPQGALSDATVQRSGRYVHLPTYRLWLRKKEYDRLTSAMSVVSWNQFVPHVPESTTLASAGVGGVPSMTRARPQTMQSSYPPPPRGNPQPGWVTIGSRVNDQWYWSGQEWTGHRRWIARKWVEDAPLDRADPAY